MAKNQQNLRIGECEAWLDDGVNPEYLYGHSKGGVEFTFEREFEDLTHDQGGETPVDMALKGNNLLIKFMNAEPTILNLHHAIPEADYNDGSTGENLGLGTDSGHLLSGDAVQLRLHPRKNAADDFSEDIYIWKAVSSENIEFAYKIDEQRVVPVTFRALYDDSQPDGQRLGRVGQQDIS